MIRNVLQACACIIACVFLATLTATATAEEGDPPLDVPTIAQGRAILARDNLRRQCEQALIDDDWARMLQSASSALEEERKAFGSDFSGTFTTELHLNIARKQLGQTIALPKEILENSDNHNKFFLAIKKEYPAFEAPNEPSELLSDFSFMQNVVIELVISVNKAFESGDFAPLDQRVQKFVAELEKMERRFEAEKSNLKRWRNETVKLANQAEEEGDTEIAEALRYLLKNTDTIKDIEADSDDLAPVFALASDGAVRANDPEKALKYARIAFKKLLSDADWASDELPFTGGKAIGVRFYNQLMAAIMLARKEGDWQLQEKLAKESTPLLEHVGLPDAKYDQAKYLTEAQIMLKLPEERQQQYVELVNSEAPSDAEGSDHVLENALRIAQSRPSFLGKDHDLIAEDANTLCVIYSRRGENQQTIHWARKAVHEYLKRRAGESAMLKTAANNYRNTLLQTIRNGELELTSEMVSDLQETTELLDQKLGKQSITAEFQIATGEMVRRAEFDLASKELLAKLNQLHTERNQNFSNGQYDIAVRIAEQCVSLTDQVWGDNSWYFADDRRALANCLSNLGQSDKAISILEESEKSFNRFPHNQSSNFGWFLHGYAFALKNLGGTASLQKAILLLDQAREIELKISGRLGGYASHTTMAAEIYRDALSNPVTALPLYQDAMNVYGNIGVDGRWGFCQSHVNVGLCQMELGLFEAAEENLRQSLQLREEFDFENPHMKAWNLWALGQNAFYSHRFEDAVGHFIECLKIKESKTPNASDIENVYGYLIRSASWISSDRAAIELERFIESANRRHGENTLEFANACRAASRVITESPYGGYTNRQQDQEIVETLVDRALDVYRKSGQLDSRIAIYAQKSKVDAMQSDPLVKIAAHKDIIRRSRLHEPVLWDGIALSQISISNLYQELNAPTQCLDYRREAMVAAERAYGAKSPRVANLLQGQADALIAVGDFDKAETLLQKSAELSLELGQSPIDQYSILSNLFSRKRDFDRAEQYLYAARGQIKQRKFSDTVDRNLRASLGRLATRQGDFHRAIEIAEKLIAEDENMLFAANGILGRSQLGLKQFDLAHKTLASIVKAIEENTDPSNKLAMTPETRLAYTLSCMHVGDDQKTHDLLLEQLDHNVHRHLKFSDRLTPRQQLTFRGEIEDSLSAYLSFTSEHDYDATAIYQNVFAMKGLVSDQQRRKGDQLTVNSPERRSLTEELAKTNQELSALVFAKQNPGDQKAAIETIRSLTARREKLQLQLARVDLPAGEQDAIAVEVPQLADLQKQLDGVSLVDFINYRHLSRFSNGGDDSEDQFRTLAFIVSADEVSLVRLGPTNEVADLVRQWRSNVTEGGQKFEAANKQVYAKLWSKIQQHLPREGTVLVAADGPLQQISFAAVTDGKGGYLIDHYTMVSVPSPRFVLHSRGVLPEKRAADLPDQILLVGGVDYQNSKKNEPGSTDDAIDAGSSPLQLLAQSRTTESRWAPRGERGEGWAFLSGTEREVDAVGELIESFSKETQVQTLRGADASEAAVGLLSSQCRWLHFATHGFFAESSSEATGWQFQSLSRNAVVGFDPQLLTGIVLSGANGDPQPDTGDGILTAAEIETLDLSNAELVVLSACETGLGETSSGEGVLGLQRALHIAGCKDVVASLWKVDDQATMVLMTLFYQNMLQHKMSKADALREAQLWMLNNPKKVNDRDAIAKLRDRGSPFGMKLQKPSKGDSIENSNRLSPKYWAAFSISGDWR